MVALLHSTPPARSLRRLSLIPCDTRHGNRARSGSRPQGRAILATVNHSTQRNNFRQCASYVQPHDADLTAATKNYLAEITQKTIGNDPTVAPNNATLERASADSTTSHATARRVSASRITIRITSTI